MNVTIIICTYNNCSSLRQTLACLGGLRTPPATRWQVLVVDNNSDDETRQVAADFAGRLPLRYVFEPRQGLSQARRRGVQESKSELIAFVDDDCDLAEDWLEQAILFLGDHPRAGAIGGRVHLIYEAPPGAFVCRNAVSLAYQDHGDKPQRMPEVGFTWLVGAALLLRRTSLEASGWLDGFVCQDRVGRALSSGGDVELVLRIRNAGHELWYNPAMQAAHHIPLRRTTLPYMCKLRYAIGQAQPAVLALANRTKPTLARCTRDLSFGVGELVISVLQLAMALLGQRTYCPDRMMRCCEMLGWVQGGVSLMFRRLGSGAE